MSKISILITIATVFSLTACNLTETELETPETPAVSETPEYTDGQVIEPEPSPEGYQNLVGNYGYTFNYPNDYLVDGQVTTVNPGYLERQFIFNKQYLDWEVPEGHPAIGIEVFDANGMDLETFATANKNYTNFSSDLTINNGVTPNGIPYTNYQVDGLYQYEYYLIENEGLVYVIYGYDNNEELTERKDVKYIVNSLEFFSKSTIK